MSEHYCKDCEKSNGNDTCSLTGALHTTGIECPSFKQKENEMNFRVRKTDDATGRWTVADGPNFRCDKYIQRDGTVNSCFTSYDNEGYAQEAFDLYLVTQDLELVEAPTEAGHAARTFIGHPEGVLEVVDDLNPKATPTFASATLSPSIRTFDSGATRDTDQGKLDYVKALSPIVIRRYVQYLDKHRLQSDGSYRDFDNWKKGIPVEAYISGGGRHFMDTWLLTDGYATEDNHGPVEIEDAICAQLFNLMGRLHEMLEDQSTPLLGVGGH